LHALLAQLGIDWRRPAEVYLAGALGPGSFRYEGWFYFVGSLDQELDAVETLDAETGVWFTAGDGALLPVSFAGRPAVQLAFYVAVPWVVDAAPFRNASRDADGTTTTFS
jgi:hypothetical protein